MKSAVDAVRFEQLINICMKHLTGYWKTHDASDLADLQRKCAGYLRQHSQISMVIVLGKKFKIVEWILVKRRAAVDLTPLGILKFIVSFGGNDVFPNLKVGLQNPADGVRFCCMAARGHSLKRNSFWLISDRP